MDKYDSNGKKWILSKYAKLMLQNPTDPKSSYWKVTLSHSISYTIPIN